MLSAESVALQARLVQQLASLRKQELDYIIQQYQSLGMQSALICSFIIGNWQNTSPSRILTLRAWHLVPRNRPPLLFLHVRCYPRVDRHRHTYHARLELGTWCCAPRRPWLDDACTQCSPRSIGHHPTALH